MILKPLLSLLGRYALTLCFVAGATLIAWEAWSRSERTPWTRDGRVGADVVRIAPEVSGMISVVPIRDNQYVHRGDILYGIDPERLRLAVAVAVAGAAYQAALATLDLAKLDLARSTVRSPVDGYVINLRLRPGDYATAGVTTVAVLDAARFWITGYFEETKIGQIHVGNPARIRLMGFDQPVSGHVESIGHGIENGNDAPGPLGLPTVAATFSWVRLAQRIPVRIHVDQVPPDVALAAGMTATIEIIPAAGEPAVGNRR
ncbi:efflux transporter periplasmic adaptor subunit [Rhodospirillum rubrum]|uniref:HlyD family efflux transporter periplasmic adaptor subunit n=1 Tax=Rhodospirillum rubrum TaxID=1085 RepID=UPI001905C78C|nr:HlyD family secretion protein [Rhodospirillum rubrum]MBK1666046.1 efflux transporter periplasmic adaptor subunit [Rhodospirillum rubrum]MBK1678146.1 efflux transporter periplasmic adaptor subunit [Rhodospirillum rubrum]